MVGHGLAGLVATAELAAAGRKVLLLDQEPEAGLGGQAFWSFGGLFFVDSGEQRVMGIKGSHDLARQDWLGTAGFDRGISDPSGQDRWAYQWAEAYVDFASEEKRAWLARLGMGSGSRSSAGPSAAAGSRTGTATRCRASMSPGAPGRPWSSRSRRRCGRPWRTGW
ncbi:FAD-binding protein [Streptomyces sp. DT2A-34]|uniref:FAD-binding protein n=1 Tax=Streptomyces sp. DT2A-34 TaxID=3051182 RepID=UPI00265C545E|nr:FAD-binding protein [Streptomyces sp. DT2A-34]MDO0910408.1 FAD-binding protein [Streptomyces sp. DT2A-34]